MTGITQITFKPHIGENAVFDDITSIHSCIVKGCGYECSFWDSGSGYDHSSCCIGSNKIDEFYPTDCPERPNHKWILFDSFPLHFTQIDVFNDQNRAVQWRIGIGSFYTQFSNKSEMEIYEFISELQNSNDIKEFFTSIALESGIVL